MGDESGAEGLSGSGYCRCDDDIGELATDPPKTDVLSRFRTLSCTRESREGRSSSRIPASKALASGRGECIMVPVDSWSTLGVK